MVQDRRPIAVHTTPRTAPAPHVPPPDDAPVSLDGSPRMSPHVRARIGHEVRVVFADASRAAFVLAEPNTGRALRLATCLRSASGSRAWARDLQLVREVQAAELDTLGVPPGHVRQVGGDPATGRLRGYGAATDWRAVLVRERGE